MEKKLDASFFEADRVLFVGYSRKHAVFCKAIREAFESRGTAIIAVNPNPGTYDTTVYASIDSTPGTFELAYVLTNKAHSTALVEQLAAKGVKRVLFNSKMSVDAAILEHCSKLGMQTAVACPMMALGGGFHRFHGWLSGVPRATARLSSTSLPNR